MGARSLFAALPLLALAACAAPSEPPAPAAEPQPAAAPAPAPAPAEAVSDERLFGRWRIVSLHGAPPRPGIGTADGRDRPYLVFGPGTYGGNTGCNSFGGYGVLLGDRFYASGAMQTAMGCGPLGAQEQAIVESLTRSPAVTLAPDGRLTLTSGGKSMVLERDDRAPPPPHRARAPTVLGGTSWTIESLAGEWLRYRIPLSLSFEADRWTLAGPCGTRSGGWRQSADHLEPVGGDIAVSKPCAPEAAALDSKLAALLSSAARFATGPNGEILIGGGGHWLTGQAPRPLLADDAPLLAGTWRIAAIDGAPPASGTEPAIAFGPRSFSGGTGCNSFQGYYLAHSRHFFTGAIVQTEMGCGALTAQERRITGLLDSAPAIARAGEGEIALVDAAGRLLLRRSSSTGGDSQGRLWTGEPLTAQLTMLDGKPLQARHADPETRLRFTAQRFDISTGCARLGGIWRRREGLLEFFTDPEPPPSGACGGALVERLPTFSRLFNGPFRALVGPGGELLVAGEDHWLTGRVQPPPRKPR